MYLGIIYLVDPATNQTFSLSRPLDSTDKQEAYDLLTSESHADPDAVDTILILENGEDYPKVIEHWTGENGDFAEF